MSLYRGAGGASDATDDSTVNAVAGYASAAASSASSAATSATSASNSASAAASSASGAASSASSVATNATNAASSASLASTYAANASASKDAAAASAATASTKAGEATSSASSAASDASTATTKAGEAAASAVAADGSADAAAASAADALAIYGSTAAVDAAVASAAASAVTASTQAGYSSDSASDSAASAVLAFENSQNAGEWATVAQGAANSSQASSSSASTYASNASISASAAATSASNALTSANNAAASAATASTIVGSGNGIFGTTPISTSGTVTLNGGTANGVAYLNGSKVLTSGSALTFDGAALRVTGSTGLYFSGSTAGHAYMAVDGTSTADYLWFGTNTNIPVIHYINGSERMRLTSTGLGIGTSSVGYRLDVNGYGRFSSGVIGAGGLTMYGDASSATGLLLDSSGNLGLGVTPSAWGLLKALDISSSGALFGYTAQAGISNNAYFDGSDWRYKNTAAATFFRANAGAFEWNTAPSGTAGNAISFTLAMTLDASGNLLIGRSSGGGGRLEVDGNYIRYGNSASYTNDEFIIQRIAAGVNLSARQNVALLLSTNDTERARIDSSGNLIQSAPATPPTLATNGQMVFNLTSNTNLRVSVRGSDGVTRVANITLA